MESKLKAVFPLLQRHGRSEKRELPVWHSSTEPYERLVAELLLRRTTRVAAERVFTTFVRQYSSWEALASADQAEIAEAVKQLGLSNQRSQYLSELARKVLEKHEGSLPERKSELKNLPGVGEYTADAVRLYAFQKCAFPVDGGVQRVLRRLLGFEKVSKSEHSEPYRDQVIKEAISIVSNVYCPRGLSNAHRGALLISWSACKSKNPLCSTCKLEPKCLYGK